LFFTDIAGKIKNKYGELHVIDKLGKKNVYAVHDEIGFDEL
jgi:hypothetical protein